MSKPPTKKVSWNNKEVEELINYLYTNCTEAGDGSNFRPTTFNATAEHLAKFWSSGATKTGQSAKNKWTAICKTYVEIETFWNLSGAHWDDMNGASVHGEYAESIWAEYIKKHPQLHKFKYKGWLLAQYIHEIMPDAGARGGNMFAPFMAITDHTEIAASADAGSQPWINTTNSGLGSTSYSASAKGKEHEVTIIPLMPAKITATCPATLCSAGKQSHSEMISDNAASIITASALPFSNSSSILPCSDKLSTSHAAKRMNLTMAIVTAAVTPTSCKSAATQKHTNTMVKSLMLGMQGSLNLLTSSLTNTAISTEDKVSAHHELAMRMLQEQDSNFPKDVKVFIWVMVACNAGFTEVYVLTLDKDECLDFVRVEVEGLRNKSNTGEPAPVALPNTF